uniref:dual adapter for phosphotyrosine and 3-phosphotyrosine and 3-phosphoinositide-like n=1 Tax=Styela clava TaxID=7725 RepID=UPI00193A6E1B|nr:dual adapter for phosphotyrosine and 3-phosphotyrosine and 3-phosphoinositide-like [Styela clava]
MTSSLISDMDNRTEEQELSAIEHLPWYHGNLTRHLTEALLMLNGVEGSYLMRDSNQSGKEYCISVRGKDAIKHFKLERDGSMYSFGISEFDSLEHLMIHFANQPILCSNSGTMGQNFEFGTLVTLKYPYPSHVEEPDTFDEIRMHSTMSLDADNAALKMRTKATPIATKAGYLTKQGGTVKTWKQRWFVCIKNQLSYFEERTDEKPINTIDLSECNECYKTDVPGKSYCFSLNFRDRTWIFSAQCESDLDDWVTLLTWKLNRKD